MTYQQTTDIKENKKISNDFKDNLLKASKNLKSVELNDVLCIKFKEDKWYYLVSDVAVWSNCKNIKTVLFYRLKKKPKGRTKTFHGMDMFSFTFNGKYAIYRVQVYARNDYDPNIITAVGFTKIPNLKECKVIENEFN